MDDDQQQPPQRGQISPRPARPVTSQLNSTPATPPQNQPSRGPTGPLTPARPLHPTPVPLPQPQPQAPPGAPPPGRPGAAPPTLQVRNLRYSYPGRAFTLTIQQLDFYPGELTYIGGESGSGKSTLIKLLAMETELEYGDLILFGQPIRRLTPHQQDDLRGGGMTYIPQGHLGLTDHTPIENISRQLHDYDGMEWPQANQRADMALRQVNLPRECFQQPVRLLSGGQQARVAIAKALATERPLCLTDEILPALDDESRKAIVRLFQMLARYGYTVVVIAHQPELKPYFHRVIEIKAGQLARDERQTPTPMP